MLGCREGRSTDTWVDFDFFGTGKVGNHMEMMPHMGVALMLDDWKTLAARLEAKGVTFDIPPVVRFEGEPGEQRTMFFFDPSGNPIEIKGFASEDGLFAS